MARELGARIFEIIDKLVARDFDGAAMTLTTGEVV